MSMSTQEPIPDLDKARGDFVDVDNDHVVKSRLGYYVDRSDAIRVGGQVLGLRRIESPDDAREVYDTEKDRFGNSNIVRQKILKDSESW